MAPKQYTEKPYKVKAKQYLVATQPPIAGVCTIAHDPFPDGRPHVHLYTDGARELHDTEVLIWNVYHPERLDALMDVVEFSDRFGNPAEV